MQYVKYIVAAVIVIAIVYAVLLGLDAFTPEAFALASAAALALAFERLPWLKDEWDKLTGDGKQGWMLILLAVLVFGAFGLSCAAVLGAFACTKDGAILAVTTYLLAIGINQGTFLLIKRA